MGKDLDLAEEFRDLLAQELPALHSLGLETNTSLPVSVAARCTDFAATTVDFPVAVKN